MNKISLCKGKEGREYLISNIIINDQKLKIHLDNLFIKENEKIKIIKKGYKSKAFIVNVFNVNYAIDKNICERIIVYDL